MGHGFLLRPAQRARFLGWLGTVGADESEAVGLLSYGGFVFVLAPAPGGLVACCAAAGAGG